MKKFTLILLSIFMMGSLMAQTGMGPLTTYNYMGSQDVALYTQMNPQPATYSVVSQKFTDYSNKIAQDADDFVVPTGKTWNITGIEVLGNYFADGTPVPPALGPADSFILQIYADNVGMPDAAPLFEQTGLTYSELSGVFTLNLTSPIQLSEGTYWISVIATMSYTNNGEWGWAWNKDPQIGAQFVNQDPDQVIDPSGSWPVSWTSASVTWPNQTQYDLCFAIIGNEVAPVPVSNWAIVIGVLLIGVFIAVRYKRTLA